MGMMDLYSIEQAKEALDSSIAIRKEFIKEIETLDIMIFILKHYVATGIPLDPIIFGIKDPKGDLND